VYALPAVPLERDVVAIESAVGVTVMENWRLSDWPALSLRVAVNVDVPGVVGVPLIVPFAAIFSPVGSAPPVSDHVYGGTPPDAPSAVLYATETGPDGTLLVVIASAGGLTASWNCRETVCGEVSVALIVTVVLARLVGVPEITPADERLNPVGSEPAVIAKVTAPVDPEVWIWKLYAALSVAFGNEVVVMARVAVVTVRLNGRVTFCELESAACAVNAYVPDVEAVPVIAPLVASASPGGRFPPLTVHCTGEVPPFDCSVAE
jgi:hypothetical protein